MQSVDPKQQTLLLIKRRIDSFDSSVRMARTTLWAGVLLSFIVVASTYTQYFSWARARAATRAELVHYAATGRNPPSFMNVSPVEGDLNSTLGYAVKLDKSEADNTPRAWGKGTPLYELSARDFQLHLARNLSLDGLELPVIGVRIASGDIGVLGALMLVFVGIWLGASINRQVGVISRVFRRDDHKNAIYPLGEANAFLFYDAVVDVATFSDTEGDDQALDWISKFLFSFPVVVALVVFVGDVVTANRYELDVILRIGIEGFLFALVALTWLVAATFERKTVEVMKDLGRIRKKADQPVVTVQPD